MNTLQKLGERIDGWLNVLTGLGIANRDKRTGALVQTQFLDQNTVEALYQSDDIAAKVVDRVPKDGCREGFELKIIDGDQELAEKAFDKFEALGGMEKIESMWKLGRLYGTALLYFGIEGSKPSDPIDVDIGKPLSYLAVLDRYMLTNNGDLTVELNSPNFGFPATYQIISGKLTDSDAGASFDWSRAYRLDGVSLPQALRRQNANWGDTIFSRMWNPLRNFNSMNDSAATIMQDISQAVFKLKNLSDMIASGQTDLVTKRLELVSRMSSICNAIVIEDGEEYERKTTAISGIDSLLTSANNRLVSSTDMPHTLLLGESPSGLGATGNSEKIDYYDGVKNEQESLIRPCLYKLFDFIFAEIAGKDRIPKYTIEFRPLWQMSDKETAEIHKIQAEADCAYADRGILMADEIADSRFGGDGYSLETSLDDDVRKALEKAPTEPENEPEGDETPPAGGEPGAGEGSAEEGGE